LTWREIEVYLYLFWILILPKGQQQHAIFDP
jgi:hypothetical protein